MTPDQYRTHQINLIANRAIDAAMAYGTAEHNHGAGQDEYRAIAQERMDKLTAIINELRDLALKDDVAQERLTEQAYELSQVHEDNQRLTHELATSRRSGLRRRVQDTDGVVFTEHPTGCWVMEDDPDSYRRLIDTWATYEQLLADAVELTELEPAPAYTASDLAEIA